MRYLSAVIIFVAGSAAGWVLGFHLGQPLATVHAQSNNHIESGCVSSIPSSWGTFRGTSEHGFVFEDEHGTIRAIQHPPCDYHGGSPRMDMMIFRR